MKEPLLSSKQIDCDIAECFLRRIEYTPQRASA